MVYNLKNARNGKGASKIAKLGSFEAPGIIKDSLNFRKIYGICMKNVAGEESKVLLSNIFLHTYLLIL